jgi:phenylacetic acid degradation operon negative regulatory protein
LTSNELFSGFIAERVKAANISSKSHLVTVFGDVMTQHGQWVWLGSLIEALAGLGFSERLVRTSVFRLVQDDWLQTQKVGRRSYYSFTESAKRHNEKAARRIYAGEVPTWDGRWLIVIPTYVTEPKLTQFRRQLEWLGFSPLVGGVFAHPSFEQQSLEETVQEMSLSQAVVIFSSRTLDHNSANVLKQLVHDRWNIKQLESDYKVLLSVYQPLLEQLKVTGADDRQSFLLRTLLIHDYRRILLKDHELPKDMLPQMWAGFDVHILVSEMYELLALASNRYITQTLKNAEGLLPTEDSLFWCRFKN